MTWNLGIETTFAFTLTLPIYIYVCVVQTSAIFQHLFVLNLLTDGI
jgi:hypothetical protein